MRLRALVTNLFLLVSLLLCGCQQSVVPQQAVASAHPLATAAGMKILQQGGNAFDAAIAVSATLAVVEPYSSGIGGGGFFLLHREQDSQQIMIDARETAPARAHATMYLDTQGNVIPNRSLDGPMAAGIPGLVAAWQEISDQYGAIAMRDCLLPAIATAKEGFVVTPHYQRMTQWRLQALRASPAASGIFLKNNEVPALDDRIVQTELAHTLQRIAAKGTQEFYQGDISKKLIDAVNQNGGIWQAQDLQNYQIKKREPIIINYRDYRIVTVPPPSSGGVALSQMLQMLSQFDLQRLSGVSRAHVLAEVMRRAYRDRAEYLGDMDFVDVPLQRLTSNEYAKNLMRDIDMEQATDNARLRSVTQIHQGNHTTHFSIIDRYGNRVAATLSINGPFGSGYVVPGTGVLLNNEMDDFVTKPGVANLYGLVGGSANAIAPGKRMLSSMTPTFVEHPDRIAILGTPGGSRIITMVLHGVLGMTEGKTAQQIVTQPRIHHQYLPNAIEFEKGAFTENELAQLQLFGHILEESENGFGNMQVVIWNKLDKQVTAASDPRGEGAATVR